MRKFSFDPLWHVLIFIAFASITFVIWLGEKWDKLTVKKHSG